MPPAPREPVNWQAFTARLDAVERQRFDDIVHRLLPVASPDQVIARVDDGIWGAINGRDGSADWNDHVRTVVALARLRDRLRSWFFERGGHDDRRLLMQVGALMLDPRTDLASPPLPTDPGERTAARATAIAPVALLLVTLAALLVVAVTVIARHGPDARGATAAIAVALVAALLSIGGAIGARRTARYAASPSTAVPHPRPASPAVTRGILVTRDSVCMADDVDAPHIAHVEIDPAADALAVARAILDSGYLPGVAGGSTWSVALDGTADGDTAVFGQRHGRRFAHRVPGGIAVPLSDGIVRLDLRYHCQAAPVDVIAAVDAARRAQPVGLAAFTSSLGGDT